MAKSVLLEREGELDLPKKVNMRPDVVERTLLALRGLRVIPRLMLCHYVPDSTLDIRHTCLRTKGFIMTSEERREARFQRRAAKRREKKEQRLKNANNFDIVMSYRNLYKAYKHCRKDVSWKASVQKYITQAPLNVYNTYIQLQDGTFKSPGFYEFDLNERGKVRHIRSTMIRERVVQNCLCDNAIVPAMQRTFIYDNGASMKGKGYSFAIKRMTEQLHRHYRKHGQEGYILLFDFSKFFDNVSHAIVKQMMRAEIQDEKLLSLSDHFIDAFGERGLGLGSQISQILALASANRLDHIVKELYVIKEYGRYMDDGCLIHRSKDYLKVCLKAIAKVCEDLQIKLNKKKTHIVKLSHGFIWLKARFYLTKTGKVIRKICKASVTRRRRKLRKYRKMLDEGIMSFKDIWESQQSWRKGYASTFDDYRNRTRKIDRYFFNLFNREINLYGIY